MAFCPPWQFVDCRRVLASLLLFCFWPAASALSATDSVTGADFSRNSPNIDLSPSERDWLAAHPHIRVAYADEVPAYRFANADGEIVGLSADVLALLGQRLGVQLTLADGGDAAAGLSSADILVGSAGNTAIPTRFLPTRPFLRRSPVIVTAADSLGFVSDKNLAGSTVVLVRGAAYNEQILAQYPSIVPLYRDSLPDALRSLIDGRADAAIGFPEEVQYIDPEAQGLRYAAPYEALGTAEILAVRPDWPILVEILNKAIRSLSTGDLREVQARWLPGDYLELWPDLGLTSAERAWIASQDQIRVGVDPEFAPFEYFEDGRYQGIASDYIALLNQRTGLNMQVVEGLSWEQAVELAQQRQIDVLPAVGLTQGREQYLNYTQPYMRFHRVIVTRLDAPFIGGVADLDGASVAVQVNSSHHGFVRENLDWTPVLFDTLQDSLLALSGGEVDAFIGNVASTTYWIRRLNLTNLKVAAPVSSQVQTLHFAVRDDWPELAAILDKGLNSISARQHKAIADKWVMVEYDPVLDLSLVWKVVAVFSLILLTVLCWNLQLKRVVRQRTAELRHSANYDLLTDLPNRYVVQERLSQLLLEAGRNRTQLALLSCDLDDFKKVNSTHNHRTGDALLKAIAQRLGSILGEPDILGRLGGDQFLIIAPHLGDATEVALKMKEIFACFQEPFRVAGEEIAITASLGVALFPGDGDTPELLLKHADTATHYAKEQGMGSYAFYTENLFKRVARRLSVEGHMATGFERGEFFVVFQPKVSGESGRISGFEALLRWDSAELGEVSPVEFIPVAERNGFIVKLGTFVLEESLAALAVWQKEFGDELTMAVNLSPVQLRMKDIASQLEQALADAGVAPECLEVEITEGVLMGNFPVVEQNLQRIDDLGVRLAMDDFGTGYSSMSNLRKYRFDTLKIDREFVADLANSESDRKLVAAIIAMARGLGMSVVAEGVETLEQSRILLDEHCHALQGWLYSKALPPAEISSLMRGRNNFLKAG